MMKELESSARCETSLPQSLAAKVVCFARFLKAKGFRTFPPGTEEALKGLAMIDLRDRRDFRAALRISLTSSDEEWRRFSGLFEAFWGKPEQEEETGSSRGEPGEDGRWVPPDQGFDAHRTREGKETGLAEEMPCRERSTYSAASRLEKKDLGELNRQEVDMARLALKRMAGLFNLERSRRRRRSRRPKELDFPGTLRGSLMTGGLPIDLRYRDRKLRLRRVIMLADVSGSMDRYARLVLPFLMGIRGLGSRAEVFVFSTDLACVTSTVRRLSMDKALDHLAGEFPEWSGGTRIGDSIQQFNQMEAGRMAHRRTVVLILSDGWDLGCGPRLGKEMAVLRRKVHRVIWLNPLAGDPHFQPLCEGMAAALPHIDHLLPASNLEQLRDAVNLLSSIMVS